MARWAKSPTLTLLVCLASDPEGPSGQKYHPSFSFRFSQTTRNIEVFGRRIDDFSDKKNAITVCNILVAYAVVVSTLSVACRIYLHTKPDVY